MSEATGVIYTNDARIAKANLLKGRTVRFRVRHVLYELCQRGRNVVVEQIEPPRRTVRVGEESGIILA